MAWAATLWASTLAIALALDLATMPQGRTPRLWAWAMLWRRRWKWWNGRARYAQAWRRWHNAEANSPRNRWDMTEEQSRAWTRRNRWLLRYAHRLQRVAGRDVSPFIT